MSLEKHLKLILDTKASDKDKLKGLDLNARDRKFGVASKAMLKPYKPKVAAVIPADFPINRVDAANSPSSVGMTAVRMHVKRGTK